MDPSFQVVSMKASDAVRAISHGTRGDDKKNLHRSVRQCFALALGPRVA
jgi:hypothetical protein